MTKPLKLPRQVPPPREIDWQRQKACQFADTRLFDFPDKDTDLRQYNDAAVICAHCPVMDQCLGFGIRTRGTGVYGGRLLRDGVSVHRGTLTAYVHKKQHSLRREVA